MFDKIKVALAGIEKFISTRELTHYKLFGWKEVSGANPVVEKKTGETKPRQSSKKVKKEQ